MEASPVTVLGTRLPGSFTFSSFLHAVTIIAAMSTILKKLSFFFMFVHFIFNDACKMAVNFFAIALPYKLTPG